MPLACGFLVFLMFSCSNPQVTVLTSQENTLRNAVQKKNESIVWTKEIDPDQLLGAPNSFISVTKENYITPQLLGSLVGLQAPVYPSLQGLDSLDCSAMNSSLINMLNSFGTALCKGTDTLADLFDTNYFYNCVFFKADFPEFLKEYTSIKLPENETESKTESKTEQTLFDRYLICRAFEGVDFVQVPLRFYKENEYVDLAVYLTYHSGYKLSQIEILGWGKLYGE